MCKNVKIHKNPEYPNDMCVLFTQVQYTQIDPKNPEYPKYLFTIWIQKYQILNNPEYPGSCVCFHTSAIYSHPRSE